MAETVGREVPAAGRGQVAEHRGGMFTMSPDGRFLAGPAADVEGLWIASGCNGSGFSSSLGLGEALAQTLTGRQPYVDLAPFAPGRVARCDDKALVEAGRWQYAHYYDPAQ
jgi:4-methylaminobutanoate oxidase (formaldehyde-forming)